MSSHAKLPSGKRLFSFVVIADTHVNESDDSSASPFLTNAQANGRARYAFAEIALLAPAPEFVVHLGDIVHPVPSLPGFTEAARCYNEIAQLVTVPVHLVPGNHDVGDKSIDWMPADIVCDAYLEKYRAIFGADYFDIDSGPLKLLVVNALLFNSGLASEAEQMVWIDEQLAATDKRVFVFIHYPPYLVHESERSTYDNIDQPGRRWLLERLRHERVEAVFAGHVHNFWYDVVGRAEMYMLPSTAFLRHDFTEMYRVAPGVEHGRGDAEKFGYFIVDVHERGHVARLVRTHGGMLANGAALSPSGRVGPVHTKTSTLRRFGVEMRHPWAEIVPIPSTGGVQEFGRKPARNDYQLMALWEMGVRTLKIPTQDLEDETTLRRAQLMSDVGHDFILTSLGMPDAAAMQRFASSGVDILGIEINLALGKAMERASSLATMRASGSIRVWLSHLRTSEDSHFDGKHFSHFVNAGLRIEELDRHRERIAELIGKEAIDGVTVRLDWGTDLVATASVLNAFASEMNCDVLASVKLATHSLALANQDDQAIAKLAAEAVVMSHCSERVRYLFDTFMDIDRGYFPRNGFIDRRFDPRLASTIVSSLCAALGQSASAEVINIKNVGGARLVEIRDGEASFVLLCGQASSLGEAAHGLTSSHPQWLDLTTGTLHASSKGLAMQANAPPKEVMALLLPRTAGPVPSAS